MKRISGLLLSLLLCQALSFGQKRLLTIDEATGMNPALSAPSLSQLQWRPGTDQFIYVAKNCLVQGTTAKETIDTLIRLRELNEVLRLRKQDTVKRFPAVTFVTADAFYFVNGTKTILVDIMNNTAETVNSWNEKAENIDIEKNGRIAAFTVDNNLYTAFDGKETAVTKEENKGIVYGSSRVHRNEFGISKGTFWSPDGHSLAFYRMDESMVAEYPLVDISTRIATEAPTRYPMAGMASHRVTVGVFNVRSGKTVYLQTEATPVPDSASRIEYLTNVTWSPDGQEIYIATLNRDQNFMQLNAYDAGNGKFLRTLFTESSDKYVEPLQGPKFVTGDPGLFIWESRRDGFNHLYLYDTDGKLQRQLTSGRWEVDEFLGTSKGGSKAWFMCNLDNPLQRQLCSVDLKKGEVSKITTTGGTHGVKISDNGKFILDTYSTPAIARQSELLDATGKTLRVLLASTNPLKDINLGETSVFTLKNTGEDDLYCRMITPPGMDPTKKYPVIIYVYGGPHSQLITDSWLNGGGLFLNYLAQQGYVVFTLDNRGTSNRGRDFEQAIFRNLGVNEVDDQMAGVRHLYSLPFVDTTRIGINGWSYGGFMTISMFLKHPDKFKVAVCGGPVIDWKYYEVMYGERYMDTPEANPAGYRNACLTNYVKDLKGKLLIIQDDMDGTVVPQNALSFLKKCVDEGKQVDYFTYPGHEHNVRGKDRIHLNQKMVQYFKDNL